MWEDQSIGCRSSRKIHYSARCLNGGDESSEEEGMEVYLREKSRGHRSLLRTATFTQLLLEVMKVAELVLKRTSTLPKVIAEVIDVGKV